MLHSSRFWKPTHGYVIPRMCSSQFQSLVLAVPYLPRWSSVLQHVVWSPISQLPSVCCHVVGTPHSQQGLSAPREMSLVPWSGAKLCFWEQANERILLTDIMPHLWSSEATETMLSSCSPITEAVHTQPALFRNTTGIPTLTSDNILLWSTSDCTELVHISFSCLVATAAGEASLVICDLFVVQPMRRELIQLKKLFY